ncbi:hypothetical protein Kpol_1048p49 [Vanderwaltozyma polyspora DSM 70294]|uniref:Uncharacterized protein n=1 Tax=Vanderwaltozyma polyspora (strain ATCC 22028 / DSM 70294 / BCRC 21397 / CBS 2163 / NBRC 10782 / NRRL Y-8283 / UCD 57-17) TaxID=436907 RepID=A7TGL1_VANPO|nr:uncharacterized protein Kpol_1048p49 [Vanderwaltozyma polyspora DSM 70294]EDO18618.1 hypothetical protein Kpol_1048p49 [Vanderwaltozyma polyspora DSM 70294]
MQLIDFISVLAASIFLTLAQASIPTSCSKFDNLDAFQCVATTACNVPYTYTMVYSWGVWRDPEDKHLYGVNHITICTPKPGLETATSKTTKTTDATTKSKTTTTITGTSTTVESTEPSPTVATTASVTASDSNLTTSTTSTSSSSSTSETTSTTSTTETTSTTSTTSTSQSTISFPTMSMKPFPTMSMKPFPTMSMKPFPTMSFKPFPKFPAFRFNRPVQTTLTTAIFATDGHPDIKAGEYAPLTEEAQL